MRRNTAGRARNRLVHDGIMMLPGFGAGWSDVAAGLGFRAEYETADATWQGNYEIGRLYALHIKAKGGHLPRFVTRGQCKAPVGFTQAVAHLTQGDKDSAFPRKRTIMPDDPDLPCFRVFDRRGMPLNF